MVGWKALDMLLRHALLVHRSVALLNALSGLFERGTDASSLPSANS